MNATMERLEKLEGRFERLVLMVQQLVKQAAALNSQVVLTQGQAGGGGGSGGGGYGYSLDPVVIAAGGNVTTQTVYALQGGTSVALPGTYTVYNQMAQPTVATAGKTIMVGANGDGTFSVITQSC